MSRSPQVYLAACLAYRNEAPYLREWIEFHRVVGVERFFLYNHSSVDEHLEALAPYVEDGIATVEDWPDVPAAQPDIFDRCLTDHGGEARWIAFLDMDEFLFAVTGASLPDVLAEYEDFPGVAVQWANFGTSGHRTKPPGLTIESYRWRSDDPTRRSNRLYKCVVDPQRVEECLDTHIFRYAGGPPVDELKRPVTSELTDGMRLTKLRINHYYTRSEEEAMRKWARPGGADGFIRQGGVPPFEALQEALNQKRDDSIARYVPAVKAALAALDARSPFDAERAAAEARRRFSEASAGDDAKPPGRESGATALLCIEAARGTAERLLPGAAERSIDRILDMRCGRGLVVRVLRTAFPDAEITARDRDSDAIAFCAEAYGAVPLHAPDPLEVETDTLFDLIWCGGVFGQLDAEGWARLLESLERRLRPWGLLLFTAGRTEASPAWICRQLETRPGLRLVTYAERAWIGREDLIACARVGPRVLIAELVEARPGITERDLVEATGYDGATVRRWRA